MSANNYQQNPFNRDPYQNSGSYNKQTTKQEGKNQQVHY